MRSKSEMKREMVDVERVCDWINLPHKPANIHFTAGPEREIAYTVEMMRHELIREITATKAKLKLAVEALEKIACADYSPKGEWCMGVARIALAELRKA